MEERACALPGRVGADGNIHAVLPPLPRTLPIMGSAIVPLPSGSAGAGSGADARAFAFEARAGRLLGGEFLHRHYRNAGRHRFRWLRGRWHGIYLTRRGSRRLRTRLRQRNRLRYGMTGESRKKDDG